VAGCPTAITQPSVAAKPMEDQVFIFFNMLLRINQR
jgi:hypothetical protein